MHGFTLLCDYTNPITVLNGNEISLKAKKGYENFIYDKRASIDDTSNDEIKSAITSEVDLEFSGKGELDIVLINLSFR